LEAETANHQDLAVSALSCLLALQQKVDLNGYQRNFQRQLQNFKPVNHSTTPFQHGNADRYGGTVRQTATLKWYYIPIVRRRQRLGKSTFKELGEFGARLKGMAVDSEAKYTASNTT
jgi:hypothetical protein